MKQISLLLTGIILFFSISAQISKDSIAILKQQKQASDISKRLNSNKLKLANLENSLDQKTRAYESASQKAQRSADENAKAASKLSDNSQDRKLAKKASRSAKDANYDARQARNAQAQVDNLKRDIESLRKKIADDEAKLNSVNNNQ